MNSKEGLLSVIESFLQPADYNQTRTATKTDNVDVDEPGEVESSAVQRVFGLDCSVEVLAHRLGALNEDRDCEDFPIRPEPRRSAPMAPDGAARSLSDNPEISIEQSPFYRLIRSRRVASSDFLVDVASKTIDVSSGLVLRGVERGSVSFESKNKSLWNRWFGGRDSSSIRTSGEGSEQDVILKRNNTFMFAPSEGRSGAELYRVVNLFRKKSVKGSKWLLHTEAAANKNTIVHAQLLKCDSISDTYYIESGLDQRRVPHAYIVCRGNEVSGRIGTLSAYESLEE